MTRLLSLILVIAAALRSYFDWQLATANEAGFTFQPIGQVWFNFDRNSLLGLQPGIERYLSPVIWENLVGPMLLWPLAPTLFGLAIIFGLISWVLRARKL